MAEIFIMVVLAVIAGSLYISKQTVEKELHGTNSLLRHVTAENKQLKAKLKKKK
jgi:hypothetical protein